MAHVDDAPTVSLEGLVEVRQTHISWVFLTDRDAFKVKRPVNLGFVDFSTCAARQQACTAEVALNRRLAPHDVYRGVVGLHPTPDGRLEPGPPDADVEWAVHMRRLPDAARADCLLAVDRLGKPHIDAFAARIARFHADAVCDAYTTSFGAPTAIAHNVRQNFAQAGDWPAEIVGLAQALEIEAWQLEFLRTHTDVFHRRMAEGRVRDGHGDLRLEHLYVEDDDVAVLDCVEFSDSLRCADVAADVAFLGMDLARSGRPDLAERLYARVARDSNDYGLYDVVDFYESYRAYVRAKIACFRLRPGDDASHPAAREARTYLLVALSARRPSLEAPWVLAVGGLPGSGKSTVADRLSARLGGAVVEADRTRKHMLGVQPHTSQYDAAWSGAYDPAFTETVYAELLHRAAHVVASGRSVVLDASFRSPRFRAAAADLAKTHGVPFRFLACTAPDDVCRARLQARTRDETASDGRVEIFDAFMKQYEPPRELDASTWMKVDTRGEPDAIVDDVVERLAGAR